MNVLQEIIPAMTMLRVLIQLAPLPVHVIQVSLEMGPTVKVSIFLLSFTTYVFMIVLGSASSEI